MYTLGTKLRVRGFGGVACSFRGHPVYFTEPTAEPCETCRGDDLETVCHDCDATGVAYWNEPEELEDDTRAIVVMVGDDSKHTVPIEDCEPIEREDYCGECGQIGCAHDGLDREAEDGDDAR